MSPIRRSSARGDHRAERKAEDVLEEQGASMKRVRDLVSRAVKTLARNDKLLMADTLMRSARIRHLPVLDDDGRLVGIVSQRDLFFNALVRALGFGSTARDRLLDTIVVKEVMTENVVTTTPEAEIAQAAQVMVDRKIGCLPVVDADVLVGILSESDIVSAVARGEL
jgi:CBS domain-containing membrane protein